MSFTWSEHAAHIQSLFRPWTPEDGCTEDVIGEAEASLGIRLPTILRSFYTSWGLRDDLTRMNEYLLPPQRLFMASDALVFCYSQPGGTGWCLPTETSDDDPPVYYGDVRPPASYDHADATERWEQSHDHVSDFLDALTYHHAFCGGAIHGGVSHEPPTEHRRALVEEKWQHIEVRSVPWGIEWSALPRRWPLHIGDGQAVHWFQQFWVVTRTTEDLEEIRRTLDLTWEEQW